MSDMPEINLDEVTSDKREIVYLRTANQHQGLVKANRVLLLLVMGLMAVVFVLGFVLLPRQNLLTEIQNIKPFPRFMLPRIRRYRPRSAP